MEKKLKHGKTQRTPKKNQLSMKQFGAIFGLAESTISLYETGKRDPDNNTLIAFANYFNVSLDYLLGREDYYGNPYQKNVTLPPVKSDIELIYESLNPRQQERLLSYAQGLLEANDTNLEELKKRQSK